MDTLNNTLVNAAANGTSADVTVGGTAIASIVLFLLAIVAVYVGSLLSQACPDKVLVSCLFFQANLEVLTRNDAAKFPLHASAALFGLYLLFKVLPRNLINFLVNLHFSFIGIGSMSHCFCPYLKKLIPDSLPNHLYTFDFKRSDVPKQPVPKGEQPKVLNTHSFTFTTHDIPGFIVAVVIGLLYCWTKHWIANNFIALTICILAIEYIRLNKFMNGALLLGGLFLYDIFWVFGTPVMVSVAKTLDAPIKVTFPRDFLVNGIFGKQLALLGLGDIVIPGIFVAMLLRFDNRLNRNGSRIYFYSGYIAYIVGLLATFIVMHTFNAAQPALLYLVPCCLGFPLFVALIQKDIPIMLSYEDEPEEKTAGDAPEAEKIE